MPLPLVTIAEPRIHDMLTDAPPPTAHWLTSLFGSLGSSPPAEPPMGYECALPWLQSPPTVDHVGAAGLSDSSAD